MRKQSKFHLLLLCVLWLLTACVHTPQVLPETKSDFPEIALEEKSDSPKVEKDLYPHFIADSKIPEIIDRTPAKNYSIDLLLFSVSVTEVPVLEFVQALVIDANMELSVVGNPQGMLTMEKKDSSVSDIMDEVSLQAKVRFKVEKNKLTLLEDVPYISIYQIDYLNMSRSLTSEIDLATQIDSISLNINGSGSGVSSSNNSRASVHNTSSHEFWKTLESNLKRIVSVEKKEDVDVIVNREAGIVAIKADFKAHKYVREFIEKVVKSAQKQVFIEALVVEVSLKEDFQAGIDWRILSAKSNGSNYVQTLSGSPSVSGINASDIAAPAAILSVFRKTLSGTDILATLTLLEQFGDVKIISSPKINALNNQSAVLKVVDNRVYFTIGVQKLQTENSLEKLTTTSEIKTVPIGLVMNVIPYISESNKIILNVRPTISRILGFVADPNPDLAAAGVVNLVPEIQVREMESVLRVDSGGMVIMGGLMQERTRKDRVGIPFFSKIPLLGKLFSYQKDRVEKTELLVFLRPVVIEDGFTYDDNAMKYVTSEQ